MADPPKDAGENCAKDNQPNATIGREAERLAKDDHPNSDNAYNAKAAPPSISDTKRDML